jgi:hypothetical protein
MSGDRVTETTTTPGAAHSTTVIERRGSGGGLLIGLAVLILVVIGAFYLMNQNRNEAVKTDAITQAARDVGSSAKKAGDAVEKAAQ